MAGSRSTVQSPAGFAAQHLLREGLRSRLTDTADLYQPASGEIAAGLVAGDLRFGHQVGDLERHVENAAPVDTDMSDAFEVAIAAADARNPVVHFSQQVGISRPIVIPSDVQQGITIEGNSRAVSIIQPKAADISTVEDGINALIINKANNGHLHLNRVRFLDQVAYTGVVLFSDEGEGGEADVQAAFSTTMRDCWFSLSTNNSGTCVGGFSNLLVDGCTFEGVKAACYWLKGVGNGDQVFVDNVQNFCYDSFILKEAGEPLATLIRVDGLHTYQHLRGAIISLDTVKTVIVNNVQVSWKVDNVGSCGLGKFKDCEKILITNCQVTDDETVRGQYWLDVEGSTLTAANTTFTGDTGLIIRGTDPVDITLDNCDFNDCQYMINVVGAVPAGSILRTRHCRFRRCEYVRLDSIANGLKWISDNDEFLDAGYDEVDTGRFFELASTADTIFNNPTIGITDVLATPDRWISANGTGKLYLNNPTFLGTPAVSLTAGTQTADFSLFQIRYKPGYTEIAAATTLVLPREGNLFNLTGATAITAIDATDNHGRIVTFKFVSTPTVTAGNNLNTAGGANFVASSEDTMSFLCIGTQWFEISRSANT